MKNDDKRIIEYQIFQVENLTRKNHRERISLYFLIPNKYIKKKPPRK